MRHPELLDAGEQLRSLENSRVYLERMLFISVERHLDFGQRQRILQMKKSKKALHLHMSMVSKFMLRQIF